MKAHKEEKKARQAQRIALCAQKALLYEVSVTPKPGLVDRLTNGAHRDMDYYSFLDSAVALLPYLEDCARMGLETGEEAGRGPLPEEANEALFSRLRARGLQAEAEMLRATGGVNTHKGAVFMLGFLTAAAGLCAARESRLSAAQREEARALPLSPEKASRHTERILALAGALARPALKDFDDPDLPVTEGLKQRRENGLAGIRGEAAAGFPSVKKIGLPILRRYLAAGDSFNDACVTVVLGLILQVDDTTMLKRSGSPEALKWERARLNALKGMYSAAEAAALLDKDWSARGLSAGGCADLLGATLFLYFEGDPGQLPLPE